MRARRSGRLARGDRRRLPRLRVAGHRARRREPPIVGAALLGLDELGADARGSGARRASCSWRCRSLVRWLRCASSGPRGLPGHRRAGGRRARPEIADGELMVLVGPVGLRQVDGAADARRARGGRRRVRSGSAAREVTDVPPKERDVAMVFQNYSLYPYLDVAANIAFPLQDGARAKAERGAARARGRRAARPHAVPGAQAGAALGRPAPAGRHGARDRARAARVPDGRAAVQPRRASCACRCAPRSRRCRRGSA